jgi:predicted dehydrogenase
MKYKVAVIGLGKQALEHYIPELQNSELAQLKAICDNDKEKLKRYEALLKVKGYENFSQLLSYEDLDFVVITTPHNLHKEIVELAIKNRVHILKEKPFATSLNEALYIKTIYDGCNKVKLMINLQRRFNPVYTQFFKFKEKIGTPFFIEAKYTLFVDNPGEGWRGCRDLAGGGCIIDMGYHIIDLIIWYFKLPDRIIADFSSAATPEKCYDTEDTALIAFGYDSGLYGTLLLSRFYPPKTEYIKVIGSQGIVEIEKGSIRRLNSNGEVVESLTRKESYVVPAINQIDYFCNVLKGESINIGNPKYHLQHMRFVAACYESKTKKTYVNPKEITSDE